MADGGPAPWQKQNLIDGNGNPVILTPFAPAILAGGAPATIRLATGATSTTAPVALPAIAAGKATSVRVRVPSGAGAPVSYTLSPLPGGRAAIIPGAYSTAGTGGTLGDKTIDPGQTAIFSLSADQQTALAAGALFLSAISPAASEIFITPGTGR